VTDHTLLDALRARHPKAVAISAATKQGLDELRDAVVEMITDKFVTAEITLPAADGRALAYLGAHADIFRQNFEGDNVVIRCHLPEHLLPRIQGPGVDVKLLD
jgi:GTP-binding protein HflX